MFLRSQVHFGPSSSVRMAPEVRTRGPFRDLADADQRLEMPKKQRRIRGPSAAVVLPPQARQPQVVEAKEPREKLLKHFKRLDMAYKRRFLMISYDFI